MTDLTSLIEKLEKAEGPDRELDRLIHFHVESPWLAEKCVKWVPAAFEGPNDFLWWSAERRAEGKEGYHDGWDSYTASVDAAVELQQGKLPGWIIDHIGQDYAGDVPMLQGFGWCVELTDGEHRSQGQSKSFAIAWLLATLRALQSRGDA